MSDAKLDRKLELEARSKVNIILVPIEPTLIFILIIVAYSVNVILYRTHQSQSRERQADAGAPGQHHGRHGSRQRRQEQPRYVSVGPPERPGKEQCG